MQRAPGRIHNEQTGGIVIRATKADRAIIDFVRTYFMELLAVVFAVFAFAIRWNNILYESGDYVGAFSPWMEQVRVNGGFQSLGMEIGNYTVPYMVIFTALSYLPVSPLVSIKLVSILFDYAAAVVSAMIVLRLLKGKKNAHAFAVLAFCAVILLPTVMLNSSAWAQCDSIYATFLLLCIWALLGERYTAAFVFYGFAFCFKFQAIFLLPLLIILYFRLKKFSLLNFLWIPGLYLATALPAVAAGRPLWNILMIYVGQAGYNNTVTVNYPNVYHLMVDNYAFFKVPGILFTILLLGLLAFAVVYFSLDVRGENLIALSILIVMLCVLFLPAMHERYAYLADILSVLYFLVRRKKLYIPVVINVISLLSYCTFLFATDVFPYKVLAIANVAFFFLLANDVLRAMKQGRQATPAGEFL
jgi:Gpi18-like mannosyltransferase